MMQMSSAIPLLVPGIWPKVLLAPIFPSLDVEHDMVRCSTMCACVMAKAE